MRFIKSGNAISIALASLCLILIAENTVAQTSNAKPIKNRTADYIPTLKFVDIPNAPKLGQPQLLMGETQPLKSEGMGWASPAFYDVTQDGKKDMLIGEFGSGIERDGKGLGNFIRVYENIGTVEQPKFGDDFYYLSNADRKTKGNGTPLSIFTWCCLGFTPRIVDLNNDGYDDLISGQYDPGHVTWFKGIKDGFSVGEHLPQFGDTQLGNRVPDHKKPWTDPDNWAYWSYSPVDFGDFDGDGFKDMIIGGNTLRISKHVGKENGPAFGRRELLLDINDKPLIAESGYYSEESGFWNSPTYGVSMIPYVVDWNNDGILDLLVTNANGYKGSAALTYFEGVKKEKGIRFQPGISLIESIDSTKVFPGDYMHLCVTDYNNDGINDIILGTSVSFRDDKFDPELTWSWGADTYSSGINPKYYSAQMKKEIESYFKRAEDEKQRNDLTLKFYGNEKYKSLYHQGYVYLLLGSK